LNCDAPGRQPFLPGAFLHRGYLPSTTMRFAGRVRAAPPKSFGGPDDSWPVLATKLCGYQAADVPEQACQDTPRVAAATGRRLMRW